MRHDDANAECRTDVTGFEIVQLLVSLRERDANSESDAPRQVPTLPSLAIAIESSVQLQLRSQRTDSTIGKSRVVEAGRVDHDDAKAICKFEMPGFLTVGWAT